jgi:gamma-glutamylputrescine oxidase
MSFLSADRDLTLNSYYAATAVRAAAYPTLQGAHDCDVAVVGGGLAGLSAALELAQKGYTVRVLEAQRIGYGASGRNGGQAIHGLACDQETIEAELGATDAQRVWAMSIEALDLIRQRIAEHGIACDWQDGYLGVATSPAKAKALAEGSERLQQVYGYHDLRLISKAELGQWIGSPRYHAAVHDPRSGHLHPLKYTLGLGAAAARAGALLHENSAVTSITMAQPRCTLQTAQGELRARSVLLAGNVYLQGLAPALQARIMPVGTYIACSEVLEPGLAASLIPCGAAVCDTDFVLDYFRTTADHRMLYGGRVSYSTQTPGNLKQSMRARMVSTFPQLRDARIEYAWGGFVDITMSRAPDFGRLAPNVYYLQGFSGHGVALTGLAGKLVAEAVHGDASRFDVFTRLKHRDFPGGAALRTPALVLGMAWYRLRDALGF